MQFIDTYPNALSEGLMKELIDWSNTPGTEHHLSHGAEGQEQHGSRLNRDDHQKYLKFNNMELMIKCHEELTPFFIEYSKKYPILRETISYEIKLQKTPIKGGYSTWHSEQGPNSSAIRAASWLVYLNDVEDGGETEFLHQGHKQKAVKGTLVMFPASYTHTHRGNPPYSNAKYIITGWANFRYTQDIQ
jgi:hypothetical protein